ncbi:MAG: hypothetical protein J3T61_00570 [Candidatus Brocadiales bacterium]|nr:hypothetical protein [Candidatus Bathyanammoxibius sp.]
MEQILHRADILICLAKLALAVEDFLLSSGKEFGDSNALKDAAMQLIREELKTVEDANI